MKKWTFAALICAQIWVSPLQAGQLRIDVNLASKHLVDTPGTLREFNEKNRGFGLEYRINDRYHVMAGEYENSINNPSVYAGGGRTLSAGSTDYFWGRYEFGAELGVADGYKDFYSEDGKHWKRGSDYKLMAGPYLRLGEKHAIKLRYVIILFTAGYQYQF